MKVQSLIVLVIFIASLSGFILCTKDTQESVAKTEMAGHAHHNHGDHEGQDTASKKEVTNKTCPISGDPIDPAVSTMHQGKKVYFCCDDCIDDFQKNPEKYLDKLPQFQGTK